MGDLVKLFSYIGNANPFPGGFMPDDRVIVPDGREGRVYGFHHGAVIIRFMLGAGRYQPGDLIRARPGAWLTDDGLPCDTEPAA